MDMAIIGGFLGVWSHAQPLVVRHHEVGTETQFDGELVVATTSVCEPPVPLVTSLREGWYLILGGVVGVVGLWETMRWIARRYVFPRRFQAVATQTEDLQVIELPLAEGIPNRARILFSLWRANFSVDVQDYPVEVQDEFTGYMGSYLLRAYRDEDSSE